MRKLLVIRIIHQKSHEVSLSVPAGRCIRKVTCCRMPEYKRAHLCSLVVCVRISLDVLAVIAGCADNKK